ncbi:MAG: hypothetical protein A4E58_00197 [Syntrophorhabdus sp. PtaB.Bin006]|nr:MAG: hypothetical protein A4E58_00197 [Syntrophorhabdus sp. PtaB.Bin006]
MEDGMRLENSPSPTIDNISIIRLGRRYGEERLEAASTRALFMGAYSYKSVESILKNNLDGKELPERLSRPSVAHENIRGGGYYK